MILREQVRPTFRITVAVIVAFAVLIAALSGSGILFAQELSPPPTKSVRSKEGKRHQADLDRARGRG